jgi:Zn-dependent protease with chaperone function
VLLWLTSLTLRVASSVFIALWVLLVLPETQLYRDLTHWCIHAEAHSVGVHFDVQGHAVGWVGSWLPSVVLVAAIAAIAGRTVHAVRVVRHVVASHALGPGPGGSVIVGGSEVVLAAIGFRRPRVVVSAGALTTLDDAELAAALSHETGHIARHHHVVLAYALGCAGAARLIPGTRAALRELRFHIERDADDWALQRNHDRFALASAICKAATLSRGSDAVLAALTGGSLNRRLDLLSAASPRPEKSLSRRAIDCAAVVICGVAVGSAIAIPAEALGAVEGKVPPHAHHHCVS